MRRLELELAEQLRNVRAVLVACPVKRWGASGRGSMFHSCSVFLGLLTQLDFLRCSSMEATSTITLVQSELTDMKYFFLKSQMHLSREVSTKMVGDGNFPPVG